MITCTLKLLSIIILIISQPIDEESNPTLIQELIRATVENKERCCLFYNTCSFRDHSALSTPKVIPNEVQVQIRQSHNSTASVSGLSHQIKVKARIILVVTRWWLQVPSASSTFTILILVKTCKWMLKLRSTVWAQQGLDSSIYGFIPGSTIWFGKSANKYQDLSLCSLAKRLCRQTLRNDVTFDCLALHFSYCQGTDYISLVFWASTWP